MAKAWGFDSDKGLRKPSPATARDPNATVTDWFKLGDVRAEMPKASVHLRSRIPMRLCLSRPDGAAERRRLGVGGRHSAEVWCGTQSQTMALEATANVLGLHRTRSSSMTCSSVAASAGAGRATWTS